MYKLEFYKNEDAEESDPDVTYELFNDNLDDLETALAAKLGVDDIDMKWFDLDLHSGDLNRITGIDAYEVFYVDGRPAGVAYIGNEDAFK